jgi:hypothetical protein
VLDYFVLHLHLSRETLNVASKLFFYIQPYLMTAVDVKALGFLSGVLEAAKFQVLNIAVELC